MNAVPAAILPATSAHLPQFAGLQTGSELQIRESIRTESSDGSTARAGIEQIELHPQWPLLSRLPMRITVAIALPHFRVRDLLALRPGASIASTWPCTDDVPLHLGEVQLGWSEFEVVEQRMAIRLTRLA